MRLLAGSFCFLLAWAPSSTAAITDFSTLPQSFEPTRGQAGRSVEFISQGPGYSLVLGPGEAWLNLVTSNRSGEALSSANVRMKVLGADRHVHGRGLSLQSGVSNYLIGEPSNWRKNIPHFGRVEYSGVYPGIDLTYYGTGRQLEYDFVVQPNADPRAIRLEFNGAEQVRIDSTG